MARALHGGGESLAKSLQDPVLGRCFSQLFYSLHGGPDKDNLKYIELAGVDRGCVGRLPLISDVCESAGPLSSIMKVSREFSSIEDSLSYDDLSSDGIRWPSAEKVIKRPLVEGLSGFLVHKL